MELFQHGGCWSIFMFDDLPLLEFELEVEPELERV